MCIYYSCDEYYFCHGVYIFFKCVNIFSPTGALWAVTDVNIREEEASDNSGSDVVEVSWVVYEEPLASVLSRYEQNNCWL